DWFAAIGPKDAPFLWFAFEGLACQYLVLPFGLSLLPRVSTEVTEEQGIRILDYLNDCLILAQSQDQLCEHKDLVLSHLSQLGLQVYQEKNKLSPMKRISFLGIELDSVEQTAHLTQERAQSVLNCLNTFKSRTAVPLKQIPRLLGHMVTPLGLLHMRPLQHLLHGRVLSDTGLPPNLHPVVRPYISPGRDILWYTQMPPPPTGGPRMMGRQYWGFRRATSYTGINCLDLLAVSLALNCLKEHLQGKHVLVYVPVACRNSPATSSGVRSIIGRFEPFTFRACTSVQPTSCHELHSPENGGSVP
ncbi:hypothetical protein M9458_035257, partial [Cirrhinus mrigala]